MPVSLEIAKQTAETFQAAAEAIRRMPLRHGNLVLLDETNADDVLITADLHGNRTNYHRILEIAALDEHPRRHVVFQEVCHGGPAYPGGVGGCMSHLMLEDIAELTLRYPERVHFLISNHELAELTDHPISKGGKMLNLLFRTGLQSMYGEGTEIVRDAYLDFLGSLPIGLRVAGEVLVLHSLPKECDERPFQRALFEREITPADCECGGALSLLVWGRDFRQENVDAFAVQSGAELFVTGHEPCQHGFAAPNTRQVVLDCCGSQGHYMLLPVRSGLTQRDLLSAVLPLHTERPAGEGEMGIGQIDSVSAKVKR